MKQVKQNLWVVSILFFSLMSAVALSYAITPTPTNQYIHEPININVDTGLNNPNFNLSFNILLPKVIK